MKKLNVVRLGMRACRELMKRVSLARNAIANVYANGSDAYKTERDDATSPLMAKHIKTYYCSEWSVFVEWGKQHEMEVITETERLVYSKRALPETYLSIARIQWQ